jgi:hypothetical protein
VLFASILFCACTVAQKADRKLIIQTPSTIAGVHSVAINTSDDTAGTPDPAAWGTAGAIATQIQFAAPAGYQVRILHITGDFTAVPKSGVAASGTYAEVGWGLKTTAPDGSLANTCPPEKARFSPARDSRALIIIHFRPDGIPMGKGSGMTPKRDWGEGLAKDWQKGGERPPKRDCLPVRSGAKCFFERWLMSHSIIDTKKSRSHRLIVCYSPPREAVDQVVLNRALGSDCVRRRGSRANPVD